MAQILASSTQWQMSVPKTANLASSTTKKLWSSLLLKQGKKAAATGTAKFRVLSVKSESSTINRLENLLNLDITLIRSLLNTFGIASCQYMWKILNETIPETL